LIRRHGEPVRWFQGAPCACTNPGRSSASRHCGLCESGFVYTERVLDSAVRAYIGQLNRTIADSGMGLVEAGTTTIAAMPDEIAPAFPDKFLLPRRLATAKGVYTRGATDTDALGHPHIGAIDVVQSSIGNAITLYENGVDYEAVDSGVRWIGSSPAAGTSFSAIYRYVPQFWFQGELKQEAPPSQHGGFLPLWGALAPKSPFEEVAA
jgi:hypothetical protein